MTKNYHKKIINIFTANYFFIYICKSKMKQLFLYKKRQSALVIGCSLNKSCVL
jgi:hypothetical protein